jgi:hypothetical protein
LLKDIRDFLSLAATAIISCECALHGIGNPITAIGAAFSIIGVAMLLTIWALELLLWALGSPQKTGA